MSSKKEPETGWLRESLRAWDPARDVPTLDAPEVDRMRRRILDAAAEPVRLGFTAQFVAAAAAVVLAIALGWGVYDDSGIQPPMVNPAAQRTPAVVRGDETQRRSRQIQFATPGGTRVVWTLDPDFEV